MPMYPQASCRRGFLAIDIAAALDLPLWDPDQGSAPVRADSHAKFSNGVIGKDPQKPQVVVAANGGSDLVYLYLPKPVSRASPAARWG